MRINLYQNLQDRLSLSRGVIDNFAKNAPNKYKVYTIPKRSGGERVIAHPSKELKQYQRAIISILWDGMTSHSSAFAYIKGKSVLDNAKEHQKNSFLLKMDFSDFFNSIEPYFLLNALRKKGFSLSSAEERTISRILFWNRTKSKNEKLILSVGAPSSPCVSNFIMFDFDSYMSSVCEENSISYTRYADDLTFSSNKKDVLFFIPEKVKNALGVYFQHKIRVNPIKTVFSSKAHNRHVTGITITNNDKLSIGRQRKRYISSLIHKFITGKLSSEDHLYLKGLLSFVKHVEPMFINRMTNKYGFDVFNEIVKGA